MKIMPEAIPKTRSVAAATSSSGSASASSSATKPRTLAGKKTSRSATQQRPKPSSLKDIEVVIVKSAADEAFQESTMMDVDVEKTPIGGVALDDKPQQDVKEEQEDDDEDDDDPEMNDDSADSSYEPDNKNVERSMKHERAKSGKKSAIKAKTTTSGLDHALDAMDVTPPALEDDNPYPKPPYSYASLIGKAIIGSPDQRARLSSIYVWIAEHFPYYRVEHGGWQNSIRHNLTVNKCFVKDVRDDDPPGKGSFWCIQPDHLKFFENGVFEKPRSNMPAGGAGSSGGPARLRRANSDLTWSHKKPERRMSVDGSMAGGLAAAAAAVMASPDSSQKSGAVPAPSGGFRRRHNSMMARPPHAGPYAKDGNAVMVAKSALSKRVRSSADGQIHTDGNASTNKSASASMEQPPVLAPPAFFSVFSNSTYRSRSSFDLPRKRSSSMANQMLITDMLPTAASLAASSSPMLHAGPVQKMPGLTRSFSMDCHGNGGMSEELAMADFQLQLQALQQQHQILQQQRVAAFEEACRPLFGGTSPTLAMNEQDGMSIPMLGGLQSLAAVNIDQQPFASIAAADLPPSSFDVDAELAAFRDLTAVQAEALVAIQEDTNVRTSNSVTPTTMLVDELAATLAVAQASSDGEARALNDWCLLALANNVLPSSTACKNEHSMAFLPVMPADSEMDEPPHSTSRESSNDMVLRMIKMRAANAASAALSHQQPLNRDIDGHIPEGAVVFGGNFESTTVTNNNNAMLAAPIAMLPADLALTMKTTETTEEDVADFLERNSSTLFNSLSCPELTELFPAVAAVTRSDAM